FLTFTGSPVLGLLISLVAIGAGTIGLIISVSPKIGGGLFSLLSILLGGLDLILSILGIIGVILF
ncbi:MAG: hypothetical protein ACOC0U_07390, partial [Desulfovibrionales bacterium]